MTHTEEEVRQIIKQDRVKYASDTEMATDLKVSRQYLNAVLHGRKRPAGKILRFYGFRRIIAYTRA